MSDGGDDGGRHGNSDNVVTGQLHQLLHDDIEHAGVGHNAEVDNGEDKQDAVGSGRLYAVLNEVGNLNGGEAQQQSRKGGNQGQNHDGGHFALEQQYNDCYDHDKADKCNHEWKPPNFLFLSVCGYWGRGGIPPSFRIGHIAFWDISMQKNLEIIFNPT